LLAGKEEQRGRKTSLGKNCAEGGGCSSETGWAGARQRGVEAKTNMVTIEKRTVSSWKRQGGKAAAGLNPLTESARLIQENYPKPKKKVMTMGRAREGTHKKKNGMKDIAVQKKWKRFKRVPILKA